MKKIITVLLLTLLTFNLLGCTGVPINEEVSAEVSSSVKESIEDKEIVKNISELVNTKDDIKEDTKIPDVSKNGFELKNISEKDIEISAESDILRIENLTNTYFRDISGDVIFFDENKDIIDIYYLYIDGIPTGEFISYESYYDFVPEKYDSYIIRCSGYVSNENNLKGHIAIKSNVNEDIFYSQLTNESDKTIENVDVRINLYEYGRLIYSVIVPIYQTIDSGETAYAEIWENYLGIEYDDFSIEVVFASEDNILDYYEVIY